MAASTDVAIRHRCPWRGLLRERVFESHGIGALALEVSPQCTLVVRLVMF